jgi:hypothetical protein
MTDRLARRYRRLLNAYPRSYRREELLDTLLESAPPERDRPTWRETANLLRNGLRARLGRPASRSVVTWAAVATLAAGLFGAAFATRAAWETSRPLPTGPQTRAMLTETLPDEPWSPVYPPPPAKFTIYGEPLSWTAADDLLLGDGNEYSQATTGASVNGHPGTDLHRSIDEATANLRAHGWTIYALTWTDAYSCIGPPCDPTNIPQDATLTARRGDTALTLEAYSESTVDTTYLSASFQRTTPAATWPSAGAGFALAAVVSLLLFGWASRRTEGTGHPAAGPVKALFGVAMTLWWIPTLYALPFLTYHHIREPHPVWHPMWEWLGQPGLSLLFVAGSGCLLLALALSALPGREPEAIPAQT